MHRIFSIGLRLYDALESVIVLQRLRSCRDIIIIIIIIIHAGTLTWIVTYVFVCKYRVSLYVVLAIASDVFVFGHLHLLQCYGVYYRCNSMRNDYNYLSTILTSCY